MVTGSYRTQKNLINHFTRLHNKNLLSIDRLNESVMKIIIAKLKIKKNLDLTKLDYAKIIPKIKKSVAALKKNSDAIINNNLKLSMDSIHPFLTKNLRETNNIKVFSAHNSFYHQIKKHFPNKKMKLHHLRKSKRSLANISMKKTIMT